MTAFIKYFTTVFFLLYMSAAFVVPSVRTYRKTGVNPVTFENTDSAHDLIGKYFKLILTLIPITLIALWIDEEVYNYLLPAAYLQNPTVQLVGMGLAVCSLVWTIIAQFQMGVSWRIGIDAKMKTSLVTRGLFSISRNPIFLGMKITLISVFLMLPNAFTLLACITSIILINVQVRLEEEFLTRMHGESYVRYKEKVSRFI